MNKVANPVTEQQELDSISNAVIGAAIEVHRALGPGLLETANESFLAFELSERGLFVEREKAVPLTYKSVEVDAGFRIDLLVENKVVVELKAVDSIAPIHRAQLMTNLKLTDLRVGLLMNFNVSILKHGLHQVVNKF